MKYQTKIIFAIAVLLWAIGAILLYKKGSPNLPVLVTGIIIVTGFVSQLRKKVSKE